MKPTCELQLSAHSYAVYEIYDSTDHCGCPNFYTTVMIVMTLSL